MDTQISMAAAESTIACMMLLLQSHISLAAGLPSSIACVDHSLIVSDMDHQFGNLSTLDLLPALQRAKHRCLFDRDHTFRSPCHQNGGPGTPAACKSFCTSDSCSSLGSERQLHCTSLLYLYVQPRRMSHHCMLQLLSSS